MTRRWLFIPANRERFTLPAQRAFAKELRAARLHADLTQGELAERAGMTRQGLAKVERGEGVTLGTIVLLARALDCQIADLFPRKNPWSP